MKKKIGTHLPLFFIFIFFLWTGFRAVDLGYHWDEYNWQIKPVQEMLKTGTFLPHIYLYPSGANWIVMAATIPEFVALYRNHQKNLKMLVIKKMETHQFLIYLRKIFIVITALSLIGVYLSVWELTRKSLLATFGALALALSWEFQYHARWVATDSLLCTASVFTFYFSLLSLRKEKFLWAASVTAGLGMGFKYPGALLFFLPLTAICISPRAQKIKTILSQGFCFGWVYIASTPGTILEPLKFLGWLRFIGSYYAHRIHGGYNVPSGLSYLLKIVEYFSFSFFSHEVLLALIQAALCGIGLIALYKKHKATLMLFAVFQIVFLIFFSRQSVFIVRNFLFSAALFSVLLPVGVSFLETKWAKLKIPLVALLTGVFGFNAFHSLYATETIANPSRYSDVQGLKKFSLENPQYQIQLSHQLSKELQLPQPSHPTKTLYAFRMRDIANWGNFPANHRDLITKTFGRKEINLKYYPSWTGEDHILLINDKQMQIISRAIAIKDAFIM